MCAEAGIHSSPVSMSRLIKVAARTHDYICAAGPGAAIQGLWEGRGYTVREHPHRASLALFIRRSRD
jgi:hypothetical protein